MDTRSDGNMEVRVIPRFGGEAVLPLPGVGKGDDEQWAGSE